MALRVDRVNVGIGRVMLGKHLHQTAAAEIAVDVPFGAHQDSVSLQCPADRDLAVVSGEIALDLDGLHLGVAPSARR